MKKGREYGVEVDELMRENPNKKIKIRDKHLIFTFTLSFPPSCYSSFGRRFYSKWWINAYRLRDFLRDSAETPGSSGNVFEMVTLDLFPYAEIS